MKAYKGFNKDLKCRGFQYEVGQTYETDEAELCKSGFHACEAPLEVFRHYAPGDGSRYCEVDLDATDETTAGETKRVGNKITIGAEIGIKGLAEAHIRYVKEHVEESVEKGDSEAVTVGARKAATAGDGGAATAGDDGAATAGHRGAATAGYGGAATAGDGGAATSRGKSTSGKEGLSVARGNGCWVRGGLGAVLVLVEEYEEDYGIKAWKAAVVDGERIKADTWYSLDEGGEFKEVRR